MDGMIDAFAISGEPCDLPPPPCQSRFGFAQGPEPSKGLVASVAKPENDSPEPALEFHRVFGRVDADGLIIGNAHGDIVTVFEHAELF